MPGIIIRETNYPVVIKIYYADTDRTDFVVITTENKAAAFCSRQDTKGEGWFCAYHTNPGPYRDRPVKPALAEQMAILYRRVIK